MQNDEKIFYDSIFEKERLSDWNTIEPHCLPETLRNAVITEAELIKDGNNICGLVIYLKKNNKNFAITVNVPNELGASESEMYFDIIYE